MSRQAPCELPLHWAVAFLLHLRARQRAAGDSPCGSSRRPEVRRCPRLSSPVGWVPPGARLSCTCPACCPAPQGLPRSAEGPSAHGGAAPLQREAFFFKKPLYFVTFTPGKPLG